jgi:hypothetical protein
MTEAVFTATPAFSATSCSRTRLMNFILPGIMSRSDPSKQLLCFSSPTPAATESTSSQKQIQEISLLDPYNETFHIVWVATGSPFDFPAFLFPV